MTRVTRVTRAGSRAVSLIGSARRGDLARSVVANCSARALAILGVAVATIVVARAGGPAAVGTYALLRMLPGLVGVLCVGGMPGALGYFLSENRRHVAGLWSTLWAILLAGSGLGVLVWLIATPLLTTALFSDDTVTVIAWAGVTVASQLLLTFGKTALQGLQDRKGSDRVIAAEELAFLPCYLLPLLLGVTGTAALVVALVLADLVVAVEAWRRVARHTGWRPGRSALRRLGRPRRAVARDVLTYGLRGQIGGMMTLLNLRLDFVVLGAMTGPAVLGSYAIASKYAELLRLPGTALTWVTYPMFAGQEPTSAARQARRLVTPATLAALAGVVPFLFLAGPVIGLLYGERFDSAVAPAQLLAVGMILGGAAGAASGYLYACGRPGLNSWALGLGVVLTVVLDLLLIPRFGVMGAAVASTTTYLLTDAALILLLLRVSKSSHVDPLPAASAAQVAS